MQAGRYMTPDEQAIHDVAVRIEALGAHPMLTEVTTRLWDARDKLVAWTNAGSPSSTAATPSDNT